MGKFLDSEKIRLAQYKLETPYLSEAAKSDGYFRQKLRPFCLPVDHADENLFNEFRSWVIQWFAEKSIKWHQGTNHFPSNHLCDSQVACVNFMGIFHDKPEELAQLLKPWFPELSRMLPVEDGSYVSFEWIGNENYLGERIPRHGKRTRGANFTSTDAILKFENRDKRKQVVLIEWKYTESYGSQDLTIAKSGTDRVKIYQHLFDDPHCLLNKNLLPGFESLFHEPFYQLMRQQFLASEMERHHELDADIVSLLHLAPEHNNDFKRITSPSLISLGKSPTDIWRKLVQPEGRFLSLPVEDLFSNYLQRPPSSLTRWADFISTRYNWVAN